MAQTKAKPRAGSGSLEVAETFAGVLELDTGNVPVAHNKGDIVDAEDPAVARWPKFFREIRGRPTVEQATSAPGEQRG